MKILKRLSSKDNIRHSLIGLDDEILIVEFYEHGKRVGEIEYVDKAYNYVYDAAENWTTGVMTHETISKYKKVA